MHAIPWLLLSMCKWDEQCKRLFQEATCISTQETQKRNIRQQIELRDWVHYLPSPAAHLSERSFFCLLIYNLPLTVLLQMSLLLLGCCFPVMSMPNKRGLFRVEILGCCFPGISWIDLITNVEIYNFVTQKMA